MNIFNLLAEGRPVYWTFEHDEYDGDKDYNSRGLAADAAQEWYEEFAAEQYEGQTVDDYIQLVQYYFDDAGEKKIIRSDRAIVSYEFTRSDYAEHNTHWGL